MNLSAIDQNHIWHPYSAMYSEVPIYTVHSANKVRIKLQNGAELIDGMSSWWCAIHGYNHPEMNQALQKQMQKMSHVMFGGLTHEPAIELTKLLLEITPEELQTVFYSDSGSVAVEVALKMAIQYWYAKGQSQRHKFISLRGAYHGDTFAAMSVSDPETGMHNLFTHNISQQIFVSRPESRFGEQCKRQDIAALEQAIIEHSQQVAAVILEPIAQATGGMWFYSADYLSEVRVLCDKYQVLLILDEIATGFGRTGKLFACQHANISADIMCIGKSLTAGYLTLAATLTTQKLAQTIDAGPPGIFMHGPTFMANPLACTAALTSIKILLNSGWQQNIKRIEKKLQYGLAECRNFNNVSEVRVLGAIGVIEMQQAVNLKEITKQFVAAGIWVRPFGKLVYIMPPYIISDDDLEILIKTLVRIVKNY